MKQTLTTSDIACALKNDANANWSWAGARALTEYLEEYEEDCGEEMELDVVAIRCDYAEYASLQEWALENYGAQWKPEMNIYGEDLTDAEIDDAIRAYIEDHGQLIEFNGGVIVSRF